MALNRDKLRNIVGGITTPQTPPPPAELSTPAPLAAEPEPAIATTPEQPAPAAGQGGAAADRRPSPPPAEEPRRFATRGRPKGRKSEPAGKARKVKVSLFIDEAIVNDIYDWAYADRMQPGEMFERALKPFHEREKKRRNDGKE